MEMSNASSDRGVFLRICISILFFSWYQQWHSFLVYFFLYLLKFLSCFQFLLSDFVTFFGLMICWPLYFLLQFDLFLIKALLSLGIYCFLGLFFFANFQANVDNNLENVISFLHLFKACPSLCWTGQHQYLPNLKKFKFLNIKLFFWI